MREFTRKIENGFLKEKSIKMLNKICKICKEEYSPMNPSQKFCEKCRLTNRRKIYKLPYERKFMEKHECCICRETAKGMVGKKFYCSDHYKEKVGEGLA